MSRSKQPIVSHILLKAVGKKKGAEHWLEHLNKQQRKRNRRLLVPGQPTGGSTK